MFDRDVTVSLNADVSNYTSSLSQAIAITKQYSSAADTALGSVAKLSASVVSGMMRVSSGLTGPTKVATDTAAAYQQQLSGIEATARVTGNSFDTLEKSTRSLARQFPIGIGQAVEQVQALQSAGVTSNKEIERLAVSFTKLGAANNLAGPQLGQQMLQVTRAFGNGSDQVDALGDSLTSVSKMWGANAAGVLTFSKAIAPIASTVGMSQTAVMGLSAAMSRLGEDGYLAANSFNKVLLDMNRGIRDGGPELKVYADLLNTTSDRLKTMFQADPTEVLMQFTEAVARAGPNVQRTLDALGLDGVRTTRSITALARSGNLRDIVNTSISEYGSGSTEAAAEEAFGGVNDQMARLSESMRQTVASAGRPFLGFMEDVLKAGNAVSDVTNKVMENDWTQKIATAGIVGGVGAGLLFKGLAATSLGSMMVNLLRSGRDSAQAQNFRQGFQRGQAGMPAPAGATRMERLGGFVGGVRGPGPEPGTQRPSFRERAVQNMRTAARIPVGAAGALMDSDRKNMTMARGATSSVGVTPAGRALGTAARDVLRNKDMASVRGLAGATRGYAGSLAERGGVGGFLARGAFYTAEGVRTAGAGIGAAGRAVGRFAGGLGITPQLAAVAGVGVLGYMAYQGNQQRNAQLEGIQSGVSQDIFSSFNQFAEAAGMAGRGLVNFTAAVQSATNKLSAGNATFEEAGVLTGEEAAQATSPGYQRAFNIVGDAAKGGAGAAESIAQQALMTLGPSATPEMVSRVVSDVTNQTNIEVGREVGRILGEKYESGDTSVDIGSAIQDILLNTSGSAGFFNMTAEESAQLATQLGRNLSQEAYKVSGVYGPEAAAIANVANAKEFYEAAQTQLGGRMVTSTRQFEATENVGKALQGMLGLSDDQMKAITGIDSRLTPLDLYDNSFDDVVSKLRQYEEETGDRPAILDAIDEAERRGIDLSNPSYESFNDRTSVEKKSYELQDAFDLATRSSSTLSESLYGVNDAARAAGLTLEEMATDVTTQAGLSDTQRLVLQAVADQNEGNVNAAATSLAEQALREARGNTVQAEARLKQEAANAQEGTAYQAIAQAAVAQLGRPAGIAQAAQPETRLMLQRVQQGNAAASMGFSSDPLIEQGRQEAMQGSDQARASFTGMARQFLMQKAQMDVQMEQMREQAGLQITQMQRDYALQVTYSVEDYYTSRERAARDFNTSMTRMERDYNRTRARATRDFNQQQEYAEQDYNTSRRRARQDFRTSTQRAEEDYNRQRQRGTEDYEKGVARAEQDYQRARGRAVRDFNISVARMESDFAKQKTRATDDYQLSIARSEEDFQKTRARANRDFERQQAYGLEDFYRGRERSIEDFNKRLKRQVEDTARTIMDPFKRIQAEMVMDAGQLVANLGEQNQMIADQMKAVDQLKAMGLSQDAVDVLGLSDPAKAQQAIRLLGDMLSDPSMIADINNQIAGRINLADAFVTDEDNLDQRRSVEDFQEQLDRAEEDYRTSAQRAAEQFAQSMADMNEDYQTQLLRAGEDFATAMARMDEDFASALQRAVEDQARALADMADDHALSLERAAEDFKLAMDRMAEDYATTVARAGEDYNKAMQRLERDYLRMVKRTTKAFTQQMADMAEDMATTREDAREDFNNSMADAEADFQKQLRRMATALENAIGDIGAGLAIAQRAAAKSLIAYGMTVAQGEEEIFRDFASYIASLPADLQDDMGESMRDLLEYMSIQFPALFKQYFPNGIAGVILQDAPYSYPDAGVRNPGMGGGSSTPPVHDYPDAGVRNPGAGLDWEGGTGGGDWGSPSWPQAGMPGQSSPITWGGTSLWYAAGQQMGQNTAEGYREGLEDTMRRWSPDAVVDDIVDKWEKELEISSPSRVFMRIGEDTIDGFTDGIEDNAPGPSWAQGIIEGIFSGPGSAESWLGNIDKWVRSNIGDNWSALTDNMPDVGSTIRQIFTDPGGFLSGLGGWITGKIGNGWNRLTGRLPDVEGDVRNEFNPLGSWLGALGGANGWIARKIGNAWNRLTGGVPEGRDLRDDVTGAFGPLGAWLGRFDSWLDEKLPGWTSFTDIFKKILVLPMEAAVNYLIRKWNDFKLTLGPFTLSLFGYEQTVGPWSVETPYMAPVDWYAEGGIVSGAQVIGVGEAGPEAVIPLNARGANVIADALEQYLGERVWNGSSGDPKAITVEMADVFLDFTDSGSEFSMQAQELLRRVEDAGIKTSSFLQAMGAAISKMIDESSEDIAGFATSLEEAFTGAAYGVTSDITSISSSLERFTDGTEESLRELTISYSSSVNTIISDTDRMISAAISRIEDFANRDWTGDSDPDPEDTSPGGDTPAPSPGGDTPATDSPDAGGGTPAVPSTAWGAYKAGYGSLSDDDKKFVNSLFGGKPATKQSFAGLTQRQQAGIASLVYQSGVNGTGLSAQDRRTIRGLMNETKVDTSFSNFDTLQSSLGKSDQEFLSTAFGGAMPTKAMWKQVSDAERESLIKALEDGDLSKDERSAISGMNFAAPSGGGSGSGEPGSTEPDEQRWWNVFSEGYAKLGDHDKDLVKKIFGGEPTFDVWATLTEGQQKRLRDAVRDGNVDKDEAGQLKGIDPYSALGKKIVEYARNYLGTPYSLTANPPSSFDCSKFTSWVYKKFGKNIASYSDTQFSGGTDVTGQELPGDLVFFKTHANKTTGHVGLYIGGGQMIDAPSPGRVVSVNRATSRSDYKGARRYFAEGGIVNRRQEAVIGEAGPEVVVPLNERGVEFFADVMARYTSPNDARQAMVSPYSTPVSMSVTQTYDNRTMFTGPIEVKSNDPDEFAARTAAKSRRQRLSQPVGSRR